MFKGTGPSAVPMIAGAFILLIILCVGAYFAFGPSEEKPTTGAVAGGVEIPKNLPGEAVTGEPVRTAGMAYYDLKTGTGQEARRSSTITVHYTGWVAADGSKFDSSVDKGQPMTTPLSNLVDGWKIGIPGMKVGGKRKLIIPAKLGYRDQAQAKIPANSDLVFDVELLAVK